MSRGLGVRERYLRFVSGGGRGMLRVRTEDARSGRSSGGYGML